MRFIAYQDGAWQFKEGLSREEARDLALGPTPVWVRAGGTPAENLDNLAEWLDLHPLAIEDVRNPRQRPKVEDYPGTTFIVVRVPRVHEHDLGWVQVGIFLGEGFLLTASESPVPELDRTMKRLLAGSICPDGRTDTLLYHVLDAVVDSYFPFMDRLEEGLDGVEDRAMESADRETFQEIRQYKDIIARTRKVVPPMREAMLSLERGRHPNIHEDLALYLRDVSDHMVRLAERLEHIKEVTINVRDVWNATLANQQNTVMKRLTVVAGLLLFPGLVAGLGGMNFEAGFPQWGYWQVTGGILSFIVVGFGVSWWKKWL